MKRLIYLLPLAVFVGLAIYLGLGLTRDPSALPSALIDRPAPAFAVPALAEGASGFSQADLASGPVTLVNFFASWCQPCRLEHPALMRLAAGGVRILGIAYKDDPAKSRDWITENGNPYARVGMDRAGSVAIDWGVYGVPETYVIDSAGHVRYRQVGPITDQDLSNVFKPLIQKLGGKAP